MDPRLKAARQAVIDHPKDRAALRALAEAEALVGNPAEAAVWMRRGYKKGAYEASDLPAVIAACLLVEQGRAATDLLREACFDDAFWRDSLPAAPRVLAGVADWHCGRDPLPTAVIFYQPQGLCAETSLVALGCATALQAAGCRVWVMTAGPLAVLGRMALGPAAVLEPGETLPEGLPVGTRRAPLTMAAWAWACGGRAAPLPQWALSAQHSSGDGWLLVPPAGGMAGGLPFAHWRALEQSAELTFYCPGLEDWQTPQAILDRLASAQGVVGQEGPLLVLAAALGKPVILLRRDSLPAAGRWWWGTRPQGSRWFPALRAVAVEETPAQTLAVVQWACRADQPAYRPLALTLDGEALGKGWADWVDDALDRAAPALGPLTGAPLILRELTDGTHNTLLHVRGAGGEHVVRTADWPVSPATFYQREFTNMRRAAAWGLAPPLVQANEVDGLIVLPYLPGPFLRNRDLRDAGVAALVADSYRILHQLDGFQGAYDLFRRARDRHKVLKNMGNSLYDGLAGCHQLMAEVAEVLTAAAPPLCACHNDAIPENLAYDGDGLVFIDWQISGMGDPHWDLGSMVGQITMTEAQKDPFYAAYFGHPNHPARSRAALYEAYCVYYNLLRAIDDGRRKPDKRGWKRRYARWSAFMDQIQSADLLPHHLRRAQAPEALEPVVSLV
jgi:aminoglycoside phosphotransferase (APT) family kinase protein